MGTRAVPERCEIVGDVFDKNAAATRCIHGPKRAVSVGGLSPVACCNTHGKDMTKFWSRIADVVNVAIGATIAY